MKTHYEVLGIDKKASADDISKAYRSLAMKCHPDRHPNDSSAVEKFKELTTAYEVLSDPSKRRQYDLAGQGKPFSSTFDDLFSTVFNFGGTRPKVGRTFAVTVQVTLEEVYKGGIIDVTYGQRSICELCNGVGGEAKECKECGGTGKRIHRGSNMSVQITCEHCKGEGRNILSKCSGCHGLGLTNPEDKTVQFEILEGVENGMRFAYRGMGDPILNGNNGDLILSVEVLKHDYFERQLNGDLLHKMSVSYPQLVLGGVVEVKTIEEEIVQLHIPMGTQPNQKLKMKRKGLPKFNNGADTYRGDQYVELKLKVPKEISEEHKELIQRLSEIEKQEIK